MARRRKYQYHKDGTLPDNPSEWIFVFGSNLRGAHSAGAAIVAKEQFGAEYGVPIGLTGRSYAIPTKDRYIRTLDLNQIKYYVQVFKDFTWNMQDMKFWVTAVGCGLAGYKHEQIAPMFKGAYTNCSFPEGWAKFLEK
jgi:hypothetical protein